MKCYVSAFVKCFTGMTVSVLLLCSGLLHAEQLPVIEEGPNTTDEAVLAHIQALPRYQSQTDSKRQYAMTESYRQLPDETRILVRYLLDGNFAAINMAIDAADHRHKQNTVNYQLERAVEKSVGVLTNDKYMTQEIVDEWVQQTPDHFLPYFVRAEVYSDLGYEARGSKYAHETREEQFARMAELHRISYKSLQKSLQLNPDFEFSYSKLIDIYKSSSGNDELAEQAYRKALTINENSFSVRWAYLDYNLPQWHGDRSTDKMQQIIDELGEDKHPNSGLQSLKGRVLAYYARQYHSRWKKSRADEDFVMALELYDKALQYGDQYYYHYQKAMLLFSFKDYEEAYVHVSRAVEIAPYIEKAHFKRKWIEQITR